MNTFISSLDIFYNPYNMHGYKIVITCNTVKLFDIIIIRILLKQYLRGTSYT